jgi:hypothetical protein
MDKSRLKKILMYGGIALVVVIIIVVIPSLFSKKNKTTPTTGGLVSSNQTVPTAPATQTAASNSRSSEIVALLRNLSGIRLNEAVFSYPTFRSLQDISILLPVPNQEGRQNPFAPIGGSSLQPAAQACRLDLT